MQHDITVFMNDAASDNKKKCSLASEKTYEVGNNIFSFNGSPSFQKPKNYTRPCLPGIKGNNALTSIDFGINPVNINAFTSILSKIIKCIKVPVLFFVCCLSVFSNQLLAQTDTLSTVTELKKLSVEQLMDIVVTSVSKSPEKLSEVASAVQVVTADEIRRSGTLRLPGALRLASNMQVYSFGAQESRISSRGFNGYPVSNSSLSNKLLVLIDGRSVYSPLFGGVFWDVQNVLLEDVKQIEVISGPGGSIWGANAVNGIVNVISKSAKETQGIYTTAASGSQFKDFGAVRFGSHIDTTFYYRVYAVHYDFNSTSKSGGMDVRNAWNLTQGGFRMDYIPSVKSKFTLQGDMYGGKENDSSNTFINGQNIIGHWTYSLSDKSSISVQMYFDRTYRNIQKQQFINELNTYDIEMQHNFSAGKRNKIVWGIGYRVANDRINSALNDFNPPTKSLLLFSGFIQNQYAVIPERLELTMGSKVLHNDYTNFEFHPTIRLAYTPHVNTTIWTAVSQAVRTPTRLEVDHTSANFGSYGDFKSEKVRAYELGYRLRPVEKISISIATYYNQYKDLRSIDSNQTPPPQFYFSNHLKARTYGVEVSANIDLKSWWRMRGGYTWMHEKFTITSDLTYPQSNYFEANDPKNQFIIQSMMDVTKHVQVDGVVRYVDVLPAAISLPSVPSYFTGI